MTYIQKTRTVSIFKNQAVMPWLVWGLGCLFYFYECLLQVSPSVMNAELMRDFGITSQLMGVLSGIYFYSYAPMQLPGGILLDYFGPRRLLTIATFICALSTIIFGLTNSFFMASGARFLIGFGSAFAAIGTMKLAANWFASEQFALLTGIMVAVGMLGAIVGEAPLALLIDHLGWRASMVLLGSIGLLLAFLIYLIARDVPEEKNEDTTSGSSRGVLRAESPRGSGHEPLLVSLYALIKNKQLWLTATYGGLMYMATPVFCGLWGVPFIMLKMDMPKAAAAHYISLVFFGWVIASPLWGIFSGRIGKRKPPLYIGSIGALFCSICFIFLPTNLYFLAIFLLLFGVFSAAFLPAFAIAKELCNQRYVATGLSFMNMINMVGVALAQPLIGFILDYFWQGQMVDGVRSYSINSFYIGLAILPIGILISLMILPFIRETYCKNVG